MRVRVTVDGAPADANPDEATRPCRHCGRPADAFTFHFTVVPDPEEPPP